MGRPVVFFDVDGTLGWDDPIAREGRPEEERSVSPRPSDAVCDAIRSLVDGGAVAFLCTGRSPATLHPVIRELPFDGVVGLGGAYVRVGEAVLRDRPFPGAVLEALEGLLLRARSGAQLESAAGVVELRGGAQGLHQGPDAPQTMQGALARLGDHRAHKLIVPTPVAQGLMLTPCAAEVIHTSELEMGNSEVSLVQNTKQDGVKAVVDYLGEDAGTTYGFGDSQNDLPLFDEVDVAVAMGNASDEVKARANLVTGGVEEDGVAMGLRALGLI